MGPSLEPRTTESCVCLGTLRPTTFWADIGNGGSLCCGTVERRSVVPRPSWPRRNSSVWRLKSIRISSRGWWGKASDCKPGPDRNSARTSTWGGPTNLCVPLAFYRRSPAQGTSRAMRKPRRHSEQSVSGASPSACLALGDGRTSSGLAAPGSVPSGHPPGSPRSVPFTLGTGGSASAPSSTPSVGKAGSGGCRS